MLQGLGALLGVLSLGDWLLLLLALILLAVVALLGTALHWPDG